MALRLDFSNMMISPGGIDEKTWTGAAQKFTAAKNGFEKLRTAGSVGFVDLANDKGLLGRLRLERTLFIVTSKSGGTAETMAQFLIVHDRIVASNLDVNRQMVFVTDPKQGALRPLAERLKIPALDIPPNVGGRFSVLTPVGTLPAALIGIDVTSLLAGAAAMANRCD